MNVIARWILGCLFAIATGLGVATVSAYSSGRWHIVPGPEILFSEICGLLAGIIAMGQVLLMFKQKKLFLKSICYAVVFSLLVIIFINASKLMMNAYIFGFERAVFKTAPVEEWESVADIPEKWLAQPSHNGEWSSDLRLNFIRNVYPRQIPCFGLLPTNDSRINDAFIMWRGVSFNSGLVIGKGNLAEGEPLGLIYKRQYQENVTIVILAGD